MTETRQPTTTFLVKRPSGKVDRVTVPGTKCAPRVFRCEPDVVGKGRIIGHVHND